MDTLELIENRYSVRKFKDTPIEDAKMMKILSAIQHAPTAKNYQPIHVFVCKSEESHQKVDAATKCHYGAPVVLVVCYDRNEVWTNPFDSDIHSGDIDAAIVADEAILEAWSIGIASCWVAMFNHQELSRQLGLQENIKPVVLIPMGYAAEDAKPAPRHTEYKALEDMVHEL